MTVTNLFDKRYIGPLGPSQFFNDATSLNNTMQAGAPREVFGPIRKRSDPAFGAARYAA